VPSSYFSLGLLIFFPCSFFAAFLSATAPSYLLSLIAAENGEKQQCQKHPVDGLYASRRLGDGMERTDRSPALR
jgi:hypothetical protein